MDLGKVAWLYGGGGFTGIRSVAYSKALLAMGIRPDFVQGVSVGTLSAAKLIECNWDIKQLEEIWLNIQKIGPSSVFDRMENYRMALLRSSRFSNKKIYSTGWRAKYSLRQGLAIHYQWVNQQVEKKYGKQK